MQEVRRKQGVSGLSQGGLARERRVTSYGEENLSKTEHIGGMEFQTFDVSKALFKPNQHSIAIKNEIMGH
jgi:hypothetical protein